MLITIAAAILSTATPTASETPAPAPAPAATAQASRVSRKPRVCIVDSVTGSHIPLRVCKRLNDWRAEGIDPLPKR